VKTLDCYQEIFNASIAECCNCYVVDNNGKRYTDFESGVWCASLGHGNKDVNQAIINQLNKVSHAGVRYTTEIVDEAAEMVLDLLGFDDGKCVFLSSGSEAVEFSVQAVRKITTRPYFLCLKNSFLSSYGTSADKNSDSWISVDLSECGDDVDAFIEDIPFDQIGAFVFEAGCVLRAESSHSKELIKSIGCKVKQNGGIIIINEVTAGIGRTGKWFGFEHFEITPDIVVCGKGIGNGYPVSVIAISKNIAGQIEQSGLKYCQSHQNDPLGCAVIKEVIYTIKRQDLIRKSAEIGVILECALKSLSDRHSCIKAVRGTGLMFVLEFNQVENFDLEKVHKKLFDAGFIVGIKLADNLFIIFPPMTIEQDMIECMVNALDEILKNEVYK